MPSFTIFGSSTTAQTLSSGETGYVGPNGALVAASGNAIDARGSFGLTVLGSVTAQSASAIDVERLANPPDTDSMAISVGMTGQITSLSGSAISGEVTFADLTVVNNGLLSGTSGGIRLYNYSTSSTGELRIFNTGTITGGTYGGIYYASSSLGAYVVNSGTIAALSPGGTAINLYGQDSELRNSGTVTGDVDMRGGSDLYNSGLIDGSVSLSGGTVDVQNSGTIVGDLQIDTAAGDVATIVNTGLIDGAIAVDGGNDSLHVIGGTVTGNITLGEGNDEFVNAGGRVTGTVDGGAGDDTYRIDSAITIQDSGGNDTIYSSVSYDIATGIERLILTGNADIHANGNVQANVLAGNSGDNRISGQRGSDELSGGNGDDTLRGGGGSDTLAFDAGDDVLNGGNGIDLLDLSSATDAFLVNLGTGIVTGDATDSDSITNVENVQGGSGNDTVWGSAVDNNLKGGSGADVLSGGNGADTLTGQSGADNLTGGTGADVFRFERLSDSTVAESDTITGFSTAQGDLIDLSLIDANALGAGNGSFLFGNGAFAIPGVPAVRVTQVVGNNVTIVEARDSVGTDIDLRIVLTGLLTLTAADFAL